MGFRPQPIIDDSLIQITDDPDQQKSIAHSLQLYRDGLLLFDKKKIKFFIFVFIYSLSCSKI
jgi:hypothetical protein